VDLIGQEVADDALVIEIRVLSESKSLVIDSTNGRRVVPPGLTLRLTILPSAVHVLRAEGLIDPNGVPIP
jgi:hypothetical protein